jgi:peptidyl-prolyl cis-trans isomerase C
MTAEKRPVPEAAGCAIRPAIDRKPKTIRVNGTEIPREAIARETQHHPAARPIDAWKAAARALAIRELLLQEARRLGIEAVPLRDEEGRRETDEEAQIRALIAREVAVPAPDTETCRRYFEQNRARFRMPDLHAVSHILIPRGADAAADAAARDKAAAILAALATDPAAFEGLARLHSACPSREQGGALGQIGPGQTVPEFEAALARMTAGAVHPEPVETRYGYHIVRLERRMEGRALPFEAAEPIIVRYLGDRVARVAERQYLTLLAGRALIEGIEIDGAATPLVQ